MGQTQVITCYNWLQLVTHGLIHEWVVSVLVSGMTRAVDLFRGQAPLLLALGGLCCRLHPFHRCAGRGASKCTVVGKAGIQKFAWDQAVTSGNLFFLSDG